MVQRRRERKELSEKHRLSQNGLFENWDSDQAVKLQEDLNKVRDVFLSFPMIPALKAAAGLYNQDPKWFLVRPPLESLNSSQIDKLYRALKKINFVMPGLNRL